MHSEHVLTCDRRRIPVHYHLAILLTVTMAFLSVLIAVALIVRTVNITVKRPREEVREKV